MDDEEYKDVEILQTDYNGNIRDEVFAFSSQQPKNTRKRASSKQKDIHDPELIEELEEVFQSAHDHFVSQIGTSSKMPLPKQRGISIANFNMKKPSDIIEEEPEEEKKYQDPPSRDVLPFFKDPKVKISLWTILKDSIGKDLSKITVPVYFNEPLSIIQRCASPMEYNDLLDLAIKQTDAIKRLAILSLYCAI